MTRRIWLFAILAMTLAAVGGAAWWRIESNESTQASPALPPAIVCPHEIDLGAVEINRTAEGVLPITNTGGQPLTLREITTGCGCLGVQLLPKRESLMSPATVTIPPGERIEIAFPLSVTGTHGVKNGHTIRFQTNAPDTPAIEVRLTFTPQARYFADPGAISFGDLADDCRLPTTVLSLFSTDNRETQRVKAVVSTDPERVKVTFVPEPPDAPVVAAEAAPGSRRFGMLNVDLGSLKPGDTINARLQVFVEGRGEAALAVPVSAHMTKPVELLPAVLYLPRSSSSGPLYSGVVLCRATGSDRLTLQSGPVPTGLSVRVEDTPNAAGPICVRVEADPKKVATPESVVMLKARRGDREHTLHLRIVIEPAK